jgi:hypothetical protein
MQTLCWIADGSAIQPVDDRGVCCRWHSWTRECRNEQRHIRYVVPLETFPAKLAAIEQNVILKTHLWLPQNCHSVAYRLIRQADSLRDNLRIERTHQVFLCQELPAFIIAIQAKQPTWSLRPLMRRPSLSARKPIVIIPIYPAQKPSLSTPSPTLASDDVMTFMPLGGVRDLFRIIGYLGVHLLEWILTAPNNCCCPSFQDGSRQVIWFSSSNNVLVHRFFLVPPPPQTGALKVSRIFRVPTFFSNRC